MPYLADLTWAHVFGDETYTDAVDAHDHAGDGEPLQAGQRVILPSSFSGGPRNMHGRYQDGAPPPSLSNPSSHLVIRSPVRPTRSPCAMCVAGMAVVRKRGKPSFFITMTCNPKCPEMGRPG